jgi:hypothetical protein
MAREIFQIRIVLTGVEPPVWRRVLVPGAFSLDRLHRVVQFAMGWGDRHLHVFDIDGQQYAVPDPDGLLVVLDELEHRLDAVAVKGTLLRYTYDFGDWWEHELTVEDVVPADLEVRYPLCVGGEGGCPPEDCGGAGGYREFLAAYSDSSHPDHELMRNWVGRDFDPGGFEPGRASTLMRRMA